MPIKIIVGGVVMKQRRKMERFCGGLRHSNHYYSCNFSDKYENIISKHSKAGNSEIVAVEMKLFSSMYSKDKFNRDVVRLMGDIERCIFVNLKITPVGFDAAFNDENNSIKVTFYLLNFNRMDDDHIVTSVSNGQISDLENKIHARVGNHRSLGFVGTDQVVETECSAPSISIPHSNTMASAVSDMVTLLGEPVYRESIKRALKGLSRREANNLLASINNIISLSCDGSVAAIEMPKKHLTRERSSGDGVLFDYVDV